jgi:iron-sulfur cluster assembly accessory protein
MSKIINITKNAWTKLSSILNKSNNKNGFIFGVTSGGCNGFNFDLRLIENKEIEKMKKLKASTLEFNETKLYIEPLSEMYLIGTTIDFINEDFNKGIFESKFIYNIDKKLASSCGCGISFTPKNV